MTGKCDAIVEPIQVIVRSCEYGAHLNNGY